MTKRGASKKGGGWRSPWLLAMGLVLLGVAGWIEGPVVARQVWHQFGMRNVEELAPVLREAARESGLDPCLLAGLVYVESRGKVDAVSNKGAVGLFQLMPAAASDAAGRLKLPPPDRDALATDALLNARLGANHLARLVKLLGPDLERVLVAYNAGRGRLIEWETASGGWAAWRKRHAERNDSPTLTYAQDVLAGAERFRARGVIAGAGGSAAPGGKPSGVQAAPPAGAPGNAGSR